MVLPETLINNHLFLCESDSFIANISVGGIKTPEERIQEIAHEKGAML